MKAGDPEMEWNPNAFYTIPSTSKGVSFFWDYTTAHWTTIFSELRPESWRHTIYNSFDRGKKGPSWREPLRHIPTVEKLVQKASGIPEPLKESVFEIGVSAQQVDGNDCGVFAAYNC
ncbi:hypothetical protein IFR05_005256 [Cadophora sp. M221]|nr:hypothetical protein IFR05_005256 [Cadophora sp. M221]